jgi:dolichol-phosphate mannosyltransferase
MHISIVSPVYGCGASLAKLTEGIGHAMQTLTCNTYEIILVNDASPDGAWNDIKRLSAANNRVKGINLARNFGQHAAIQAGLSRAQGEWVVVMDCDLQDRPDQIPALYAKALEGYDLALARREIRSDAWSKRMGSRLFYGLLGYLTETKIDPAIANFGIYHRKVVTAILEMGDYVRFFPSMAAWVGFNKAMVNVQHDSRATEKSGYSFRKLLRLGINVILSFSDKPLRLTVKFGFIVTGLVVFFGLITLLRYLSGEVLVLGYTSLILSIWFLGGLIISILGIVGLYMGKVFDQTKNRPVFIVKETIGGHDD